MVGFSKAARIGGFLNNSPLKYPRIIPPVTVVPNVRMAVISDAVTAGVHIVRYHFRLPVVGLAFTCGFLFILLTGAEINSSHSRRASVPSGERAQALALVYSRSILTRIAIRSGRVELRRLGIAIPKSRVGLRKVKIKGFETYAT